MPALVHGGKAVAESEAICRFVDKTFQGASLVPAGSASTVDKFLKLVADVAHEDLVSCAFLKAGHPGAWGCTTRLHFCRFVPLCTLTPLCPLPQWPRCCCPSRRRAPPPSCRR